MSADSISWLLPAQETRQRTLWALSQIREQTRGRKVEIILIDRPSAVGLGRNLPSDVLLGPHRMALLPLPYLLQAGLNVADGEIVIWSPNPTEFQSAPGGDRLREPARHPSRCNSDGLAISRSCALLKRLSLRLCHETFVARRATAHGVAQPELLGRFSGFDRRHFGDDAAAVVLLSGASCIRRSSGARLRRDRWTPRIAGSAPDNSLRSAARPLASVIITAHNEGQEALCTIESVEASTSVRSSSSSSTTAPATVAARTWIASGFA